MLTVSTMALAAMMGSACGTNMANMNNCNQALMNQGRCDQGIYCQENGQGCQNLDSLLTQMGVSQGQNCSRF